MKDVLSLVTFVLAALCFVVFVTTVKPDAMSAFAPPTKSEACQTLASWTRGGGLATVRQPGFGPKADVSRTVRPTRQFS
jgi:hypothetical protein